MNNSVEVSPDELWIRFEFLQNQLTVEYMREKYARMKQTSEAQLLRQAFSIAIEQWDDAQIEEFLCTHFFPDLPESEMLAKETPEARRQLFERLYRFIILGESGC